MTDATPNAGPMDWRAVWQGEHAAAFTQAVPQAVPSEGSPEPACFAALREELEKRRKQRLELRNQEILRQLSEEDLQPDDR